jgi:hypothetical protein
MNGELHVQPVDPRIIASEHDPVYHVYFWSDRRRNSDEYEVTNAASVQAVLDWAETNADGREVEIAVVIRDQATYIVGPLDHSLPPIEE